MAIPVIKVMTAETKRATLTVSARAFKTSQALIFRGSTRKRLLGEVVFWDMEAGFGVFNK